MTAVFDGAPETLPRSLRLHEWARQVLGEAPARARRAQRERAAALSLFASLEQIRLLETIGRLPLLTESDLRLVLAVPLPLLSRQVERAERDGLIDAVIRPNGQKHFVLGEFGLRLLAARAGVPFRRFANHTPFVAALPGAASGRLQTLVRQFEHTVGANSFMLACLRGGPGADSPTLAVWQNPIEAVVRFESGGVRRALRPDGAGEVVQEGSPRSFFLEWDRGTERINVLLEKLTRYAAYYRSASAASADALLVVTPTPHREIVVWRAVSAVMRPEAERGVVRTTVASLVDQYGPYAPIWRQFGSDARGSWPGNP